MSTAVGPPGGLAGAYVKRCHCAGVATLKVCIIAVKNVTAYVLFKIYFTSS